MNKFKVGDVVDRVVDVDHFIAVSRLKRAKGLVVRSISPFGVAFEGGRSRWDPINFELSKSEQLVYTQEMKDAGEEIELDMRYLDSDGLECTLIGENNYECVYVGRPTREGIHQRHLSVCKKNKAKPIDTRTPAQKQVDTLEEFFMQNSEMSDKGLIQAMQKAGFLAEVK